MATRDKLFDGYLTEAQLLLLIEKRYPSKEYALFSQVPPGTGYVADPRTADALVLSLWPSRGLTLTGFEIKSHHGDWKREKRKPEKAERMAAYCDFWFLVGANASVAPVDEVPEAWGLLVPDATAKSLVMVKQAQKLEAQPFTRRFVAALLRRASDSMVPSATLAEKIEAARTEGRATAEKGDPVNSELARLRKLEAKVREFERHSGLLLEHGYNDIAAIGKAAALVMNMQREVQNGAIAVVHRLESLVEGIDRLTSEPATKRLREAIAAIGRDARQLSVLPLVPVDNERDKATSAIVAACTQDLEV